MRGFFGQMLPHQPSGLSAALYPPRGDRLPLLFQNCRSSRSESHIHFIHIPNYWLFVISLQRHVFPQLGGKRSWMGKTKRDSKFAFGLSLSYIRGKNKSGGLREIQNSEGGGGGQLLWHFIAVQHLKSSRREAESDFARSSAVGISPFPPTPPTPLMLQQGKRHPLSLYTE